MGGWGGENGENEGKRGGGRGVDEGGEGRIVGMRSRMGRVEGGGG